MDGGALWAAVCGIAQSRTRLKRLSSSSSVSSLNLYSPRPSFHSYSCTTSVSRVQDVKASKKSPGFEEVTV